MDKKLITIIFQNKKYFVFILLHLSKICNETLLFEAFANAWHQRKLTIYNLYNLF